MIKPLGFDGRVYSRLMEGIARHGKIVRSKRFVASTWKMEIHYDEFRNHWNFTPMTTYFEGKEVEAIVLEGGPNIVADVRKAIGHHDPAKCGPEQLRSLTLELGPNNGVDNLIHAADSAEAVEREISLWFDE